MMNAPEISSITILGEILRGVLCKAGQCREHTCSSCSYNSAGEVSKLLQGGGELNAPVREFDIKLAKRIQDNLCIQSACESRCVMCLYSPINIEEFMKRVGNDCT